MLQKNIEKMYQNLWREALKYLLLYTQPMILCWHNFIVTELDKGWNINNFVWHTLYDITVNVTVALFNWKEHNATQTTKQWGNIHDYKGRKKTQCNPVKQDKGGNTK